MSDFNKYCLICNGKLSEEEIEQGMTFHPKNVDCIHQLQVNVKELERLLVGEREERERLRSAFEEVVRERALKLECVKKILFPQYYNED